MLFIGRRINGLIRRFGSNTATKSLKSYSKIKLQTLNNICIKRFSTDTTQSDINYEEITNGDKELEHKLKVIALEAEVMRQDGKLVPEASFLSKDQWKELLSLRSRSARQKYLEFLFKLEKKEENKKAKTEERKKSYEEYLAKREKEKANKSEESYEEFALKYDLQHNNICLRFYDTTINQMYNNRLIQAMQFGQKLIVDLGFDSKMSKRENINCAKQLMLLFAENRAHDEPFDIHFCNANKQGDLMKYLYKFIPTAEELWFPLNLHECSYLDKFSKDQLVYLTPHVREEVKEYDHDAIYIIGAIVDKNNQEPLSLAKAKREGLKMAKLPLDRHLLWGAGSGKSLTLNQVGSILLDQRKTGNWEYSLRHVPKRKLVTEETSVKSIDQAFARNRKKPEKARWSPSYSKVDYNNLGFNRNESKTKNYKDKMSANVRNIFND